MISHLSRLKNEPLLIIGTFWPLVLLVGHMPGIPRPSVSGLPWRLELALTGLLTLTMGALLINKGSTERLAGIDRKTLAPLAFAAVFVIWILLSTLWATERYPAIHLGLQWTNYLVFLVLMTSMARARVIRSSFITLAIVIWVLATSCAIESWFGAPLTDSTLKAGLKPLLRGSSGFGEVTGVASILFASLALHLNKRRIAFICGATALAAWLATLQSLERAPFIGTCVGLLLLGSVVFIRPSKRLFWRVGPLAGAFILVFLLQSIPTQLTNHDVATATRLQQDLTADPNTRVRFLFWDVGVELLAEHPLIGVGANNYQVKFAEGRAAFANRYPTSRLVDMNDHLLTLYAHNEYVQLAAELGVIGFILFVLFCVSLVITFIWQVRLRHHFVPVLGAAGAMFAFAVSSGASASSFRYLGGGLMFFFAAALLCRKGSSQQPHSGKATRVVKVPNVIFRPLHVTVFLIMLLGVCVFILQAAGSTFHALAESSSQAAQAERYYRLSMQVSPEKAGSEFGYGMWLFRNGRAAEAEQYLRFAMVKGFNSSVCFAYLAGAQATAGNLATAEGTLDTAVQAYPRSVFLLVRHSVALERVGRNEEAETEFSRALEINSPEAKGWRRLIVEDIDAALAAAKSADVAGPGELRPEAAVLAVLQENELKNPGLANEGWRKRMRVAESHLTPSKF